MFDGELKALNENEQWPVGFYKLSVLKLHQSIFL